MATALTTPVSGVVERVAIPAPPPISLVPTPVSVAGVATASISLPRVLAAPVPVTTSVPAAVPVSGVVATTVSVLATVPYISVSPPDSVMIPVPFPVIVIPPPAPVSGVVSVGCVAYPISTPAPSGVCTTTAAAREKITFACSILHFFKHFFHHVLK